MKWGTQEHKTFRLFMVCLTVLLLAFLIAAIVEDAAEARTPTYATCYHLQGTMANGKRVHKRAAASNRLRLGTKIRLVGRNTGPQGRRLYIISDTGGSPLNDGHLDLWWPNCAGWHNPRVTYKIGWGKP
jgi:hypothetical protein